MATMGKDVLETSGKTFTMTEVLEMMKTFATELKKPYVDEDAMERLRRERQMMIESYKEGQSNLKANMELCPHTDDKDNWAINTMHNFYDQKPRGICMKCGLFIEPAHWEIMYDKGNVKGKPVWVQAHPQYNLVLQIESKGARG